MRRFLYWPLLVTLALGWFLNTPLAQTVIVSVYTFTLGSTVVTLGQTTGTIAGLTLTAPALTGAATASGSFQVGGTTATVSTGESALAKIAASGSAPGASWLKMEAVAGTNAGTCKIIAYAGTSTTPVTIVDNVGAGC